MSDDSRVDDGEWAPAKLDTGVPHSARMYDWPSMMRK